MEEVIRPIFFTGIQDWALIFARFQDLPLSGLELMINFLGLRKNDSFEGEVSMTPLLLSLYIFRYKSMCEMIIGLIFNVNYCLCINLCIFLMMNKINFHGLKLKTCQMKCSYYKCQSDLEVSLIV